MTSIDDLAARTARSLASEESLESLALDPYWPKWDGPWWRMVLLHEMGLAAQIPDAAKTALVEAIRRTWLPFFPLRAEEIPAGTDPYRQIACHCAAGTIDQVLLAAGVELAREVPWLGPWFLRYQLPDGGLNCDEAAYTRPAPRSSIVSTLPALEAVLRRGVFGPGEASFLDRGARYLVERRLCRSLSRAGAVIDERFLEPCFPRFYEYDVLRGLSFLVAWAEALGRRIPRPAVEEVLIRLEERVRTEGGLVPRRRFTDGVRTIRRAADGAWARTDAGTFPLLDALGRTGERCPWLERELESALRRLPAVLE